MTVSSNLKIVDEIAESLMLRKLVTSLKPASNIDDGALTLGWDLRGSKVRLANSCELCHCSEAEYAHQACFP